MLMYGAGGAFSVMLHGRLGCRSFRVQTAWIGFVK